MSGILWKNSLVVFCAAVLVSVAAAPVRAVPIDFSFSGSGNGCLGGTISGGACSGGTAFSDFVITATGDTNTIIDDPTILVPGMGEITITGASLFTHTSASIAIGGLGVFDFVTDTATFFKFTGSPIIGFQAVIPTTIGSTSGIDTPDLINIPLPAPTPPAPPLQRDDLLTLGAFMGQGEFLQWDTTAVMVRALVGGTDLALNFVDGFADFTFEAELAPAPVPLPAALPLMGTALALLAFLGWRRRRSEAA